MGHFAEEGDDLQGVGPCDDEDEDVHLLVLAVELLAAEQEHREESREREEEEEVEGQETPLVTRQVTKMLRLDLEVVPKGAKSTADQSESEPGVSHSSSVAVIFPVIWSRLSTIFWSFTS